MKKYQSYKPSGVDWLEVQPEHWISTKLKYVSTIITGNTPSKNNEDNYTDGKFLWIKPDGLNEFKPTNDCKEKISEKGLSETRIVPPYSVLINGIGNIGKFGYSELPVSTNQQIHSIVFEPQIVDKRYGLYLISSLKDEMNRNSEKVVVSIYTKSKLERLDFILPPLQEQEQIVNYLDEKTTIIDKLISTKLRKVELLKEQRITLINQVITKGLNPKVKMKNSGVEWIGEIPEGWEVKKLFYFGEVNLGKMLTPEDKGGNVLKPYLRSQNIQSDRVDVSDVKEMWFTENELIRLRLRKDDLLLNEGGDVGRTCIWNDELDECYIQNSVNRVRFNNDLQRYFLYLSNLYHYMKYYDSIVNRVSIPHLTKEKLESVRFLRPPIKEQEQIVQYLDKHTKEIDDLVSMEQNKIELLKEYRQSLISEVITGKIKVL